MKKLLLLLIIASVGFTSYAQDAFSFGVKGGASFFSYDTELGSAGNSQVDIFEQETVPGFTFGVFTKIYLGGPLYLQPEAYYARKSVKQDITHIEGSIPITFTKNDVLHYIDVPVLLNATIVDFTYAGKLYGLAGPTASFLTSAKEDYSSGVGTITDPDKQDEIQRALANDFNTVTFTMQAGLGYEIRKFHVDLRYERGLSTISKENYDMTLNNLMVSVGLKFM